MDSKQAFDALLNDAELGTGSEVLRQKLRKLMTNSIPIERLRELVEEWREMREFLNGPHADRIDRARSLIYKDCADQAEALIKEVENE